MQKVGSIFLNERLSDDPIPLNKCMRPSIIANHKEDIRNYVHVWPWSGSFISSVETHRSCYGFGADNLSLHVDLTFIICYGYGGFNPCVYFYLRIYERPPCDLKIIKIGSSFPPIVLSCAIGG
ncbi:hypothetical protein M413DRAFT_305355 [Hebeloma cylindrosporum]|uniref:Uncharacterized protein n=1 Tax=Hebeloma cylindrosporum TaxID=76867 RepID=A0A0C2Y8K3_HEBCY|nr:hypothetical protein M413DRAFT_305355 [Hebeloma cylindrosporum h7]